ncbi:MAG: dihydrodipicolinate synthase family protein [Thermoplasmataceae archaeon]
MSSEIVIPMITPFRNNQLDRECLHAFIGYAEKNGFDGLFAGSSTGAFASLSMDQHGEFLKWVMEFSHSTSLYAGVTRSSLPETLNMVKLATDLGYEKLVAINPFYHKYSQDSIARFFDAILTATDANIYAYNNPPLSGTEILPATLARLKTNHSNLAGLKDSGGNLDRFREFLKIPGLKIFQGKDALLFDSIKIGASGGVCSSANYCLNTMKIVRNAPDSEQISEKTRKLIDIVSKYETPSIHNYLFRTQILGEKSPRNYVNKPYGDVVVPPSVNELKELLVLP